METCCDYLTIASQQYRGNSARPNAVLVGAGQTVQWRADASVTRGGFLLCAIRNTSPNPPSPPPPPPPPPPHPPGMAPMGYHMLDSGNCEGESIQTRADCNAAARFLGLADTSSIADGQTGVTCAQMPVTSLPSPRSVALKHHDPHPPPPSGTVLIRLGATTSRTRSSSTRASIPARAPPSTAVSAMASRPQARHRHRRRLVEQLSR